MIFAYSSNAFVKFNIMDTIDMIALSGFGGLEIMCDRPHVYPPDFDEIELKKIKKSLEKNNLKLTNLNCFTLFAVGNTYLPSWIEPDENRRNIRIQHTKDCLKIADLLGCKNISIPPGGPLENMERKEATGLFYKGLEQVVPMAEELKINILIEPEPDLFIENTNEFKNFIKDIKSDFVGINFDIGHFYCVEEDPAAAFEELYQWIGHVHLEDIAGSRVHEHLIPGHGAISFKQVFQSMKKMNYTGDICLELYPYTDTPEKAGMESLEFLNPIFEDTGLDVRTKV